MSWGAISNDEGLVVYQRALQFVMTLYGVCAAFPPSEKDHLTKLLKQAAVAVTKHISEAGKKTSGADKIRRLNTAMGYLDECGYYLDMAEQQRYLSTAGERSELKIVKELLTDHINSIDSSL